MGCNFILNLFFKVFLHSVKQLYLYLSKEIEWFLFFPSDFSTFFLIFPWKLSCLVIHSPLSNTVKVPTYSLLWYTSCPFLCLVVWLLDSASLMSQSLTVATQQLPSTALLKHSFPDDSNHTKVESFNTLHCLKLCLTINSSLPIKCW